MTRHEKVVVNRLSAVAVQTGPIADPKQLRADLRTLLRGFADREAHPIVSIDAADVRLEAGDARDAMASTMREDV